MDRAIFELARRQHGVIGRAQLVGLGLTGSNIEYRLGAGRLQVLHRGVYGLGPIQSKLAHWMAAVLAGGREAVLSHRSAAELWGLIDGRTSPVHVTAPSKRERQDIRFHRSSLPDDERTVFEGIRHHRPAHAPGLRPGHAGAAPRTANQRSRRSTSP